VCVCVCVCAADNKAVCVCVCVCAADNKAIYCIVRAGMKCVTEMEEGAVVGTKLQNEEHRDTGQCYCGQRG
jgi:hypothetical protein